VFGALLAPAALSLLATTFVEPSERGKAFGVFGALAGSGAGVGLLLGGVLTEYLSWRWCLYVNLLFAGAAVAGGAVLLRNQANPDKPRLDLPGILTATAGLFALVYGFSNAETQSWTASLTLVMFAVAAVLLAAFILIERRVAHPLLPLRVVLDRDRGASYLAVGLSAIAIFAVFLFLTYYLQRNLAFSPVETGLAFLPMVACIMFTSITANVALLSRTGARPLVPTGMLLGCAGMLYLTGLGAQSSYAAHVLPALIVLGLGFGLIFAPAINTATLGVAARDTGIASAMVNTSQQVGGAIGTAMLSTIALNATGSFAAGRRPSSELMAQAAVHGYTTAFYWSATIFAVASVVCGLLLRPKAKTGVRVGEPVLRTDGDRHPPPPAPATRRPEGRGARAVPERS
jgi:predicted MFS family arabinose efflux permease